MGDTIESILTPFQEPEIIDQDAAKALALFDSLSDPILLPTSSYQKGILGWISRGTDSYVYSIGDYVLKVYPRLRILNLCAYQTNVNNAAAKGIVSLSTGDTLSIVPMLYVGSGPFVFAEPYSVIQEDELANAQDNSEERQFYPSEKLNSQSVFSIARFVPGANLLYQYRSVPGPVFDGLKRTLGYATSLHPMNIKTQQTEDGKEHFIITDIENSIAHHYAKGKRINLIEYI